VNRSPLTPAVEARPTASPPGRAPVGDAAAVAVSFEHVSLAFDDQIVLRDVSFAARDGRFTFLLGGSGSGKSVILKLILGLFKPDRGEIRVGGTRIDTLTEEELVRVRGDIGMLFQETALFDSMTVADNVGYRLREELHVPADEERTRVEEVLGFVGLAEYGDRMPSELSGGQRRRVAIARAMAARPRLLLLDDPTSGLDPITSRSVMDEIIKLRDLEHVTAIVVTHQLPHAFYAARHQARIHDGGAVIEPAADAKMEEADFLVLRDGGIAFAGHTRELLRARDPDLVTMLSGWEPPLE
jgi:phospholipid/cholesterol/gamma-HCH transport system ATP-binding protein